MEKRGQVTIFIIIAIMIVAVVIGFFMFKDELKVYLFNPEVRDVQLFVETCIEDVSSEGVLFVASRGGYFNLPDNYFKEFPTTSYWIYGCNDTFPNIDLIEGELSKYIEEQVGYCLDSQEFTDKKVEFGEKNTEIKIKEDIIFIELQMETSITTEESTELIEDYQFELKDDKLLSSITLSKNIINEIKKDFNILHLTSIFNLADQEEFDVNIDSYNEEDYLFQLNDRSQGEYLFNFAVNLKC